MGDKESSRPKIAAKAVTIVEDDTFRAPHQSEIYLDGSTVTVCVCLCVAYFKLSHKLER